MAKRQTMQFRKLPFIGVHGLSFYIRHEVVTAKQTRDAEIHVARLEIGDPDPRTTEVQVLVANEKHNAVLAALHSLARSFAASMRHDSGFDVREFMRESGLED